VSFNSFVVLLLNCDSDSCLVNTVWHFTAFPWKQQQKSGTVKVKNMALQPIVVHLIVLNMIF